MKTHFNEDFRLVLPGELVAPCASWRARRGREPLAHARPGRLPARLGQADRRAARLEPGAARPLQPRALRGPRVSAGWDLIIIDEAHRLGGSTEQVARFKLGEALAQAAPYLLLLSATPHQGKTDAFRRLIGFLDADAFPDDDAITREAVRPSSSAPRSAARSTPRATRSSSRAARSWCRSTGAQRTRSSARSTRR